MDLGPHGGPIELRVETRMPFRLVVGGLVPLGKKEAIKEADVDGLQRIVFRRSNEDVMIARRERRESEVIIKGGMAA